MFFSSVVPPAATFTHHFVLTVATIIRKMSLASEGCTSRSLQFSMPNGGLMIVVTSLLETT